MAPFIILIGLFIVLYVLLLPPSDREALLGESDNVEQTTVNLRSLLSEFPGRVSPDKVNIREHNVDLVNLYIKSEPETENLFSDLSVSRSFYSNKDRIISFGVEEIENLENIRLTFFVEDSRGDLIVELNGNIIYEGAASSNAFITLPVNLIKDVNELRFSANSVGFGFWNENFYDLKDIKLVKEFEKIHSTVNREFFVTEEEKSNLESSTLEYVIYCNELRGSTLFRILLNDNSIYSKYMACVREERNLILDRSYIREGSNELKFIIDQGDFVVDSIKVVNKLIQGQDRSYGFYITDDQYNSILSEKADVVLSMSLSGDEKVADIEVNGFTIRMDVDGSSYSKDISEFIMDGDNIIRIIPIKEFFINSLKVELK